MAVNYYYHYFLMLCMRCRERAWFSPSVFGTLGQAKLGSFCAYKTEGFACMSLKGMSMHIGTVVTSTRARMQDPRPFVL